MAIRRIIRELTPPLVARMVRRGRPAPALPNAYTWEGIYPHFRDVPVTGNGFGQEEFVAQSKSAATRGDAKGLPVTENALFPMLAASWHARHGSVSVLDVGGGAGLAYTDFRNTAPRCENVTWHVVEVPEECRAGRELFPGGEVTFHETVPEKGTIPAIDLANLCGVLQYLEDYRGVIRSIAALRPQLIYALKVICGNFSTFATAQLNVRGTVIPAWFFNREEIIALFEQSGYQLIYHGLHDRDYDTTNFPPELQWKKASHLLFARGDPA